MQNKILAGGIIVDSKKRILLIHRNTPVRKQWEMPGGTAEYKEMPTQTVRRELKEELGIDVEIIKKLGQQEIILGQKAYHYYWYQVEIIEGTPTILELEYDDLRYFSFEDLKHMTDSISLSTHNLVTAYFNKEIILEIT